MDNKIVMQDNLLKNIKENLSSLEKILEETNSVWNYEDLMYRFYHCSFKVYAIQYLTKELVKQLEKISPHDNEKIKNEMFLEIISKGAGNISWEREHNKKWSKTCRPFLEAFFHSRYFIEVAVKYGKKYEIIPEVIESGWAALLELYGIR